MKKTTYNDIAAEAGVSVATISRLLTGSTNVSEVTKDRIFAVMARHGYNVSGLQLLKAQRKSGIIIFNIPTMGNIFYSKIAQGAKSAANRHGYQLLINEEHLFNDDALNLIGLIQKINPAGLILTNHVPREILKKLWDMIPLVQCCEYDKGLNYPYISVDDISAANNMVKYLISLGRKRIAYINGPIRYKYAQDRLQGYLDALNDTGMEIRQDFIIQLPENDFDMAFSSIGQILNANDRPDAFFCASDVCAAAAIKYCLYHNLNVPRDVSVAGFDNTDISVMTNPTITTVNQPRFQMGFSCCEMLIEMITNPETPIRSLLLNTELIIRESTARF
jgi:LacI family repressor for deo operon, udp, cdd, tsx, nupC, and nupG